MTFVLCILEMFDLLVGLIRPESIEAAVEFVEFTLLGVGFCGGTLNRPVPVRLGSPPKGGMPPPPVCFVGAVPKSFCNKKLMTANIMITKKKLLRINSMMPKSNHLAIIQL